LAGVFQSMTSVQNSQGRFPDVRERFIGVQYARAAAALGVLMFHAAQRGGHDFAVGARGVDLFFVISGFIMWTVSTRRENRPMAFFGARLKRIVPLYWIATLSLAVGALAGLFPTLRQELTWSHLVQSLLFIPHVSPGSGQIWPVLVPGWTLNLEMFFYVVFAACLLLRPAARLACLTLSFLVLVVAGLFAPPSNALAATYTDPLILEFVAGVWLAVLIRRMPRPGPLGALLSIGAGAAALLILPFWGGLSERLACLAGATLCLYGVLSMDLRQATPDILVLRIIGDASYSIYLWHGVAVSVAAAVAGKLGMPAFTIIPAAVAGGLILGAFSYFGLERPIGKLLSRSRPSAAINRRPPDAAGAGRG